MKDIFIQIQIAKDYHESMSIRRQAENNLIEEGKIKDTRKTKKK